MASAAASPTAAAAPFAQKRRGLFSRFVAPRYDTFLGAMRHAQAEARKKGWPTIDELETFLAHAAGDMLGRDVWFKFSSWDIETGLPFMRVRTEDWSEYLQLSEIDCPRMDWDSRKIVFDGKHRARPKPPTPDPAKKAPVLQPAGRRQ